MDNDKTFTSFGRSYERASQRGIQPTAIKPAQTAVSVLVNTDTEILGPLSLNDGVSVTVTSIIRNANPTYRIGGAPYCIAFFQTSLSTGNIIGSGVTAGYSSMGPFPMPTFTPYATDDDLGGNDGDDLVYITSLTNNTGSTQVIYALTNTRVYTPTGGQAQ